MDREEIIDSILPFVEMIRKYHQHEVVGLEELEGEGRMVVIANHSLATYDIVLLMCAIYTDLGRLPRPLVDRLFYKLPYIGDLITHLGGCKGNPEDAIRLLQNEEIITVAPGGMREALRPSSQRYQVRWDKRTGFARLAIKAQAPVVLAACPKADDLYDVYPNPLTAWFYKKYKVPVFLARGLGPTVIPKPVKLVHHLSEPIKPPLLPDNEADLNRATSKFHKKLVTRMIDLMSEAIQQAR